jgi:hypothetical protein
MVKLLEISAREKHEITRRGTFWFGLCEFYLVHIWNQIGIFEVSTCGMISYVAFCCWLDTSRCSTVAWSLLKKLTSGCLLFFLHSKSMDFSATCMLGTSPREVWHVAMLSCLHNQRWHVATSSCCHSQRWHGPPLVF